jgi:hypothetical protein
MEFKASLYGGGRRMSAANNDNPAHGLAVHRHFDRHRLAVKKNQASSET